MNRHALPIVALLIAGLVTACGGGGSAPSGQQTVPLSITTTSMPDGTTTAAYTPTQIQTVGEQGAVTFTVVVGSEPPGLSLSTGGLLSGTPTANGAYPFTVEANDGTMTATQDYTVTIADLSLEAVSGLTAGDAWTERDVSLDAVGESGPVTFSVVLNGSGGSFTSVNAAQGTAVWTPGTNAGNDLLRATDDTSGESADLLFAVLDDPTVNYAPGFGTNDVWWVSLDVKRGLHGYQSDWHNALVQIGMWPTGSAGPAETDLEHLIELCVRLQLLRELNLIYRRNADGSEGVSGLKISFPYAQPQSPNTAPPVAQSSVGNATQYSVMEIANSGGQASGVLGVAFLDTNNPFHDHNGGPNLGVLIDHVTTFFAQIQSNRLITGNPINDNDVSILKALIYETPMIGTRYNTIRTLVEFFARAVALVTAHEIGHSLGLDHNGQNGTLMASSISFGTSSLSSSNAVPLTAAEVATLAGGDLPGPGRSTLPLSLFGGTAPVENGDICICHSAHAER